VEAEETRRAARQSATAAVEPARCTPPRLQSSIISGTGGPTYSAVAQRAVVQFTTPGLVTKHLSAKRETVLLQASITSSVQSSSFLKALTSGTISQLNNSNSE